MLFAVENQLPAWTQFVDTFGVPAFLVLFGAAIFWKLMPHLIDWIKKSTHQADIVALAVPRIEKNLETIADGSKHMKDVAKSVSRTEEKTDAVLHGNERLETTAKKILDEVRRKRDAK